MLEEISNTVSERISPNCAKKCNVLLKVKNYSGTSHFWLLLCFHPAIFKKTFCRASFLYYISTVIVKFCRKNMSKCYIKFFLSYMVKFLLKRHSNFMHLLFHESFTNRFIHISQKKFALKKEYLTLWIHLLIIVCNN